MTKNSKKILSLILIVIFLLIILPAYFFLDIGRNSQKTSNYLSSNDSWSTNEYEDFDKSASITAKDFLISTSHKKASKAGAKILKKGGNAIDAIIAAQMVLNVVEPQSSGIGGGAFLLYYNAKNKKTHYFNGRETAPINSHSEIFLDANGQPKKFHNAVKGGLSVGTPSLLKMLKLVHDKYGKLEWSILFDDAIKIANDGFVMDKKIHNLANELSYLKNFDGFAKIYLKKNKKAKNIGELIQNKDLANTFQIIADKGIEPFYEGKIAKNIANIVQNSQINPGYLSLEDLKNYQAKEDKIICAPYRKYKVCSAPLPSSGGITLLQILGILENFDLREYDPSSFQSIHLISEATRLAYADRNKYIGDVKNVPINKMLSKKYLRKRSKLIKENSALPNVQFGKFKNWDLYAMNKNTNENPSTTHLSVIDKEGNIISMTSSIEYTFGSALIVDGFLLNNQLTDFSFIPQIDGKEVINNLKPLKQPRSSMTPTFVFDENNKLILTIGSPGGPRIIQYVLKTIIAFLDWNLNLERAISLPNFVVLRDVIELEKNTKLEKIKDDLINLGHKVKINHLTSGLNAIHIDYKNNILIGNADFRRNGSAIGE